VENGYKPQAGASADWEEIMSQGDGKQVEAKTDRVKVNPEKRADILQATFEHYYGIANDHLGMAATTSNILLVIIGAILVLVGVDREVCGSPVDVGSAIAVILIGLFGALWTWKQHQKYYFWKHTADNYQRELTEIVPGLKQGDEYEKDAIKKSGEEFRPWFAEKLYVRHLWVGLHLIVVFTGIGLLLFSLLTECAG
jgi:hypothetical protein